MVRRHCTPLHLLMRRGGGLQSYYTSHRIPLTGRVMQEGPMVRRHCMRRGGGLESYYTSCTAA